jgi:hypothetical protein
MLFQRMQPSIVYRDNACCFAHSMRTNGQPVIKNPKEVAKSISEQLAALSVQAREVRLDTLGYLIEMARLEAENAVRLAR